MQSLFPAPSPIPPSGRATLVRVLVLIAVASVIWVPIGVWVGLRPGLARIVQPVAQFLAAFPANLLFPVAVSAIVAFALNPDIWLSPLMILGTQWYILFNVIAGASALPSELRDVGTNLRVRGWLWWRRTALPGVLPFYVTGVIGAALDLCAYEREPDHAMVLGAGVPLAWLDGQGVAVRHLRTPYGPLSYSIKRAGTRVMLNLRAREVPPGGFVLRWPGKDSPGAARINGRAAMWRDAELRIHELPATVVLEGVR